MTSRKGDNNNNRSRTHLEIKQSSKIQADDRCVSSVFEPQWEQTPYGSSRTDPVATLPDKKLTLFALRLAVLEKAASGLGTLGFIWATVVLLGGFATTLDIKDFWVVILILLVEGTRIFSRSHELEWRHQGTAWSLASAGRRISGSIVSISRLLTKVILRPSSVLQSIDHHKLPKTVPTAGQARTPRTSHSSEVPIFPDVVWVLVSKNVSQMLYWLQIVSAAACGALSLMQLSKQDYGPADESGDQKNKKPSLNMFYGLALAEALVFLVEKVYCGWNIGHRKLMEQVCRECELGQWGMVFIKRFFYDSYSRCIQGSIFDGLKMDLISFAKELLDSDSRDEQLIGARILHKFATSNRFSGYTLRKIGTSTAVVERMIEMLNWKNSEEEEIRWSAGEIISKLAGKKHNAIRIAGVPGSMESITSLLYTGRIYDMKPHEIGLLSVVADRSDYDFSAFNLLGLRILKKLAREHENCWKMGTARGLIPMIIDFMSASENLLRNDVAPESQIETVKQSLQLVKMLVRTTGKTGEMLRKEMSEIVFAVSNIRNILQFGERHMVLQKMGIEILTSMAIDAQARETIGATGSVIRLLLSIFFGERLTEDQNSVSIEAGEALAVLALGSRDNCSRMLKVDMVIERLIELLGDEVLRVNSARILMNLCAYSRSECHDHLRFRGITAAAPTVMKAILIEKEKLLEISLGLATQIFRFTTPNEFVAELRGAGVEDDNFVKKLVEILKIYNYPEIKVPRIRRFVIELAIWMMKSQKIYIHLFKDLGAEEALKDVAETTSELECFNIFSGSDGLLRDKTTVSSLVDTALELMA